MKRKILFKNIFLQGIVFLFVALMGLSHDAVAQQDPRDEFYTPPSNSQYVKAANGGDNLIYEGNYKWALRFYPARLWYSTSYFGIERSLTKSFSVALDAGWHGSKAGLNINAFGPAGVFDEDFGDGSEFSTQTYPELIMRGDPLQKSIPTVGFSATYFGQEKEGHNVPFLQFQYQFTQSQLLMKDDEIERERFAGGNDTASLQLHTAMLRYGRQWTYGQKIKFINTFSVGIGANMRISSAYQAVGINSNTSNFYYLNSLKPNGEMRRFISPRFQFSYSIGIGY